MRFAEDPRWDERVDEQLERIFRDALEQSTDIRIDPITGDLIVNSAGDLDIVRGEDAIFQQIMFRIRTVRGTYAIYPECGTELMAMAGAPNSEETGMEISDQILRALTHDGFIPASLLQIEMAPTGENEITGFIFVEGLTSALAMVMDLRTGEVTKFQKILITS